MNSVQSTISMSRRYDGNGSVIMRDRPLPLLPLVLPSDKRTRSELSGDDSDLDMDADIGELGHDSDALEHELTDHLNHRYYDLDFDPISPGSDIQQQQRVDEYKDNHNVDMEVDIPMMSNSLKAAVDSCMTSEIPPTSPLATPTTVLLTPVTSKIRPRSTHWARDISSSPPSQRRARQSTGDINIGTSEYTRLRPHIDTLCTVGSDTNRT